MREYIDTSAIRHVIDTMLADKTVTRRDLVLASYLYIEHSREDVIGFYGGPKNRAEASRALKRLAPYLDVEDDPRTGRWYVLKRKLVEQPRNDGKPDDGQIPGQMSLGDYK